MGDRSRSLVIAFICGGMLFLQCPISLVATPRPPQSQENQAAIGVITLANLAHIGKANAVGGTTVYAGDTVDTEPGGELRLMAGPGQIYLHSDSAANLLRSGAILQAALVRGTVGFSGLTDRQFQIITPEGIVEAADGLPAFGQVTTAAHNDIVISAYSGALVLHRGAQTLIVKPGQSYYVELVADPLPPQRKAGVAPAYSGHLEWRLIVVGAEAGLGYYLWQFYSISPFVP